MTCLILRTPSGISGDMLVTGLSKIGNFSSVQINRWIQDIGVPELKNSLKIHKAAVQGIAGWQAKVKVKHCHHHRPLTEIHRIIRKSRLSVPAKKLASAAFDLLAKAEGEIHHMDPRKVEFHEIGGLDSILDICLSSAMFAELDPAKFFVSPLPVCDGNIRCAHGILSAPAPATLLLLKNVPVYGIDSEGETVTPTAIALLKAFGASFGRWPSVKIKKSVRIYGGRLLPNVPNGAVFILGESETARKC
jgi:uncharacterized protein (DUF111 family)